MRTHTLKTWQPYFDHVRSGKKRFEYRRDDRGFVVGDFLDLKEYNPATKEFSGEVCRVKVVYKIAGKDLGVAHDYCVMGIEPAYKKDFWISDISRKLKKSDDPKYWSLVHGIVGDQGMNWLTLGIDQHPDDYEAWCGCDYCNSYGDF